MESAESSEVSSALSHAREADSEAEVSEGIAELAPMRAADAKVWAIVGRMQRKEWERGRDCQRLAAEWRCSVSLVEQYAAQASRFLRLIKEPEMVRAWAAARLTEIGNEDEGDRVPAILGAAKVAGVLDPKGNGPAPPPPLSSAERNESLRALLRDPPPELEAILVECWGPRTVGG